jgi:hypothetical protein
MNTPTGPIDPESSSQHDFSADSSGTEFSGPDGTPPPVAFTIRHFPPIERDLVAAPRLPRYSQLQWTLVALRAVVVGLQVITLALVLSSKHYSGRHLAVLGIVCVLLLIALECALFAVLASMTRQRAKQNAQLARTWQWQGCLFLGPYDDDKGVVGSRVMYTVYERQRRAPLLALLLTDHGFGWTSTAFMKATGGRSLVCALSRIDHVDVIAGSAPNSWWTVMRPSEGWRSGQLRIIRKDGREALFTGVRTDHLVDRLLALGGHIGSGLTTEPVDPRSGSLGPR